MRINPLPGESPQGKNLCQINRSLFPTGLLQPQGCLKFGMDALMLAAFCQKMLSVKESGRSRNRKAVELGCGCGAALFALALADPALTGWGIDREEILIAAARHNAAYLGLEGRLTFMVQNLEEKGVEKQFMDIPCRMDLALANPPWLPARSGKPSPSPLKERAITGGKNVLAGFCRCAATLLEPDGIFCAILPPARLDEFLECCHARGLWEGAYMPLTPFAGRKPTRILIMAQKKISQVKWLPALALHERHENGACWSREAKEFCPWLSRQ